MRDKSKSEQLWETISNILFKEEGSLPEIRLTGLTSEHAAAVFSNLLEMANTTDLSQTIWHEKLKCEVPLSELPNAGALAADGVLSSLHVILSGIRSGGTLLPDLGVSVYTNEVALDYRPGSDWNPDVLAAFIELLSGLRSLEDGGRLEVADEVVVLPEDAQRRFRAAVAKYFE